MNRLKQRMAKRIATTVLLAIMIISNLSIPINALTAYTAYDIKQVVYSNFNRISPNPAVSANQRGLVKYLHNIIITGMWVDFAFSSDEFDLTAEEQSLYYNMYKGKIDAFNKKFSDTTKTSYEPLALKVPGPVFKHEDFINLANSMETYLTTIMETHKNAYNSPALSNEAKSIYLTDNKSLFISVYEMILRFNQDYEYLRGLTAKVDSSDVYSLSTLSLLVFFNKSQYKTFFDFARTELDKSINSSFEIKVTDTDDKDDLLGKFIALDPNSGEQLKSVNKAYLAVVAASSVYVPFESAIGDEGFLDALDYLTNKDVGVATAYAEIAYYKKPIYYREKEDKGDAIRLSLGTLIDRIRSGDTTYLLTIKGKFATTEDSDIYVMTTNNTINRYQDGTYEPDNGATTPSPTTPEQTTPTTPGIGATTPTTEPTTPTTESAKPDTTIGSESLIDDEGNSTVLEEVITKTDSMSEPFLEFSSSDLGFYNRVLLNNLTTDKNPNINMKDDAFTNQNLYITPFGDIVLADNTIIVPASSNSSYYSSSDVMYNPFTEAFMDNYPSIANQDEFKVPEPDIGKLFFQINDKLLLGKGNIVATTIKSTQKFASLGSAMFTTDVNFNTDIVDYVTSTPSRIFVESNMSFKGWGNNILSSVSKVFRVDTNSITGSQLSSPLYPSGNVKGEELTLRNNFIASAFYSFLVMNEDGTESELSNDNMNTEKFYDLMIEMYNGKKAVAGYEKTVINQTKTEGFFSWLNGITKSLSDIVSDLVGEAPGLLGLRSMTQDKLMGSFIYYAKTALGLVLLFILVIFLFKFTNKKDHIAFVVFQTTLALVVATSIIYVIPKYLGDITNMFVNNSSNSLAFKSLQLRQEMMLDSSEIKAQYSDFGTFGYSSSSIILYNFTDEQLKEICEEYELDYLEISSGGSVVTDDVTGLFIQGNKLKINLDKLFLITSINTITESSNSMAFYKLEKVVNVDSVINYYTPYDVISNGIVEKLNTLSSVYKLTRAQIPYARGIRKDSFFMDSYVRSPVYMSPNDFTAADKTMDSDLEDTLNVYFNPELSDPLGLDRALKDAFKNDDIVNSLWYKTMVQNGFIADTNDLTDAEMAAIKEDYADLINYVNKHVKKFLLDNVNKLSYMADENLIEITSLYATLLFNGRISSINNMVYPQRLNYEELNVVDTLRPIISKDYNMFASTNRDLSQYVSYEFGFFGSLGYSLILVFQGLTSLILTYFIYIMYLILVIFLAIRVFFKTDKIKNTFYGFLKLYGVLMGVYFTNVYGLSLIYKLESSGLTLLLLIALSSLCCGFAFSTVMFTITGLGSLDFNNDKIGSTYAKALTIMGGRNMSNGTNKIRNSMGRFTTRNFEVRPEEEDRILGGLDPISVGVNDYTDVRAFDSFDSEEFSSKFEESYINPNGNRDSQRSAGSRNTNTNRNVVIEGYENDF